MEYSISEIKAEVHRYYSSESDCAQKMGMSKQKFNRIMNLKQEPSLEDIQTIAKAIKKPAELVFNIFLLAMSPNEQRS